MSTLNCRKASLEDFEDFYRIKCDKKNILWGGYLNAPEKRSFYEWYSRQMTSTKRTIYLVQEDGVVCAFFYIDKIDDEVYELAGSGVLTSFTGKGIGTYCVKKRLDIISAKGGKSCFTWIAEDNVASYRRFEKMGFVRTDEFEMRNLQGLGGGHKFYKWVKEL